MLLSICDLPDVIKVMKIIKIVIKIIKIVVPIILIISAMIDLLKAVSDAELNKITKPMINKVLAAILIFFIPTFVKIIASITLNDATYESCFNTSYNIETKNVIVKK